MLAPTDRRLLLDALAPEPDWAFDQAIGTTYTLDLLALLRVPLAATTLPWTEADGEPLANPFALLSALRQHASRISLFCHAGATKVPPPQQRLFTFLEESVNPVLPPLEGIFHPKLWLLRFTSSETREVSYRLLVLSRNLTFDRCWDIALALEGRLVKRRNAFAINRPLSELVVALPAMAARAGHNVDRSTAERVSLFADELLRVSWEPPEDFELAAFHPLGLDRRVRWPFRYLHRLLVVSPFVGSGLVENLGDWPAADATLIARFEELTKLDPAALRPYDRVYAFDDGQGLLDAEDQSAEDVSGELAGLHAKLFLGEAERRARVWIGSANATEAALGAPDRPGNSVEFLVELDGVRARHGVEPTLDGLLDAGLLQPFVPAEEPVAEEPREAIARELELAASRLAAGKFAAYVTEEGPERLRIDLRATDDAAVELPPSTVLTARPITIAHPRTVHPERDPAATFPVVALVNVTPFFAFTLTATRDGLEVHHEFVARLRLEGAPEGRHEAVIAELLSDPERLFAFLLLLLSSDDRDSEEALRRLEQLGARNGAGRRDVGGGLPLLEPLLRTLDRDPERLDEIGQLLEDLSAQPETAHLIPEELRELWTVIEEVRAT